MKIYSKELRTKFLHFFSNKGHKIIKTSPVFPVNDATLLFTNSGMIQFKDIFTGIEQRSYKKVCSNQKCIRAGGKHNDLEHIGYTTRHHVFFEMLGNFSFGDYFKEESCIYAWDFLTKYLMIDPNKLKVTIFNGDDKIPEDRETEKIWKNIIGLNSSQINYRGITDNFWSMSDIGPCGPSTEIYYSSEQKSTLNNKTDIELWNLVFMQYERTELGSLVKLPVPCVDTGMGLERLCAVVNNFSSNYETDLFRPYIDYCSNVTGKYYKSSNNDIDISFRIIADHCRAISFIIADGILPSSDGRGYVLRRIIRRAMLHAKKIGVNDLFCSKICNLVVKNMGEFYPELYVAKSLIEKVVNQEELLFQSTLIRGLQIFNEKTLNLKNGDNLDSSIIFKLYNTYGFPEDLTISLAKERQLVIKIDKINKMKLAHKQISKKIFGLEEKNILLKKLNQQLKKTIFLENQKEYSNIVVIALLKENQQKNILEENDSGIIILDKTPFYGQSGGQVGDVGCLYNDKSKIDVLDTKKFLSLHLHYVRITKNSIKIGDIIFAKINYERRKKIRCNHTATHLLNSALRHVLGNHVIQKGSLINEFYLHFDFVYFKSLTSNQIIKIENLVNHWILECCSCSATYTSLSTAKKLGALSILGKKYINEVKIVSIGSHSLELCKGTHVRNTGEIGQFKIISEVSVSSGIRRIEAVSGMMALYKFRKYNNIVDNISKMLSTSSSNSVTVLIDFLKKFKCIKDKLNNYEIRESINNAQINSKNIIIISGIKIFIQRMNINKNLLYMQNYVDHLRNIIGSCIVVLGGLLNKKAIIIVALTKDLSVKINAKYIIHKLAKIIDGTGGGKTEFAQAGGSNYNNLDKALSLAKKIITKLIIS